MVFGFVVLIFFCNIFYFFLGFFEVIFMYWLWVVLCDVSIDLISSIYFKIISFLLRLWNVSWLNVCVDCCLFWLGGLGYKLLRLFGNLIFWLLYLVKWWWLYVMFCLYSMCGFYFGEILIYLFYKRYSIFNIC